MTVRPNGIEIFTGGDAGSYYALATLRQMIRSQPRRLGCCRIEDWPDFSRRGFYLDCSRGKVPTVQTIKELIGLLAGWKINELQLYVENVFAFHRHPQIGKGFSPFTPQDLLEIQDHCRAHHVRFVGSLASFGHMEKILALPEYSHLKELPGGEHCSTLCPSDPGSIRLVAELYEEFVPLFQADDFNICGDETWELGAGRSKARAKRLGAGRIYMDFLLKIHRLCQKHGKRTNAWADIVLKYPELLGDWPKDIVMLNWDYGPHGKRIPRTHEITDVGLPLVVCPGTNAWGSHGCRLAEGMANISNFAAEGLKNQAQGLLNTDWGDGGHRNMQAISLHNVAWGGACSWALHQTNKQSFSRHFTESFCLQTFGPDRGDLSRKIRILGRTNESLNEEYINSSPLYGRFLHPTAGLVKDSERFGQWIDGKDERLLAGRAEELSKLTWPATKKTDLVDRSIQEYALGTFQDSLACRRMIIIKRIRQGRPIPPALVRPVLNGLVKMEKELPRVWALGNRPSRLADIVVSLKKLIREHRAMLK